MISVQKKEGVTVSTIFDKLVDVLRAATAFLLAQNVPEEKAIIPQRATVQKNAVPEESTAVFDHVPQLLKGIEELIKVVEEPLHKGPIPDLVDSVAEFHDNKPDLEKAVEKLVRPTVKMKAEEERVTKNLKNLGIETPIKVKGGNASDKINTIRRLQSARQLVGECRKNKSGVHCFKALDNNIAHFGKTAFQRNMVKYLLGCAMREEISSGRAPKQYSSNDFTRMGVDKYIKKAETLETKQIDVRHQFGIVESSVKAVSKQMSKLTVGQRTRFQRVQEEIYRLDDQISVQVGAFEIESTRRFPMYKQGAPAYSQLANRDLPKMTARLAKLQTELGVLVKSVRM